MSSASSYLVVVSAQLTDPDTSPGTNGLYTLLLTNGQYGHLGHHPFHIDFGEEHGRSGILVRCLIRLQVHCTCISMLLTEDRLHESAISTRMKFPPLNIAFRMNPLLFQTLPPHQINISHAH